MTSSLFSPFGGAGSFGHPGAGGSVGFADPENGIGFGYVMNRMCSPRFWRRGSVFPRR
jgi:CubicO group peptidase (beta-lactamase class C family)